MNPALFILPSRTGLAAAEAQSLPSTPTARVFLFVCVELETGVLLEEAHPGVMIPRKRRHAHRRAHAHTQTQMHTALRPRVPDV